MSHVKAITIVFCILFYKHVGGQTLGAKASVNLSNIAFAYSLKNDTINFIPTFSAGLFSDIQVSKNIYIRTELNYAQKGMKTNGNITKIHYIEIPVSFMYKSNWGYYGNFFLATGIYAGIAIAGKITGKENKTPKFKHIVCPEDNIAMHDFYRKTDLGAKLYAGYEFKNNWGIGTEIAMSLTNIAPHYKQPIANSEQTIKKNVAFSLFVTYAFKKF